MNKVWHDQAWDEYLCWQKRDRKTLKRINSILKDIDRSPFSGIGKPEPLKHERQGYWSRRIDDVNRIVYKVESKQIVIVQCGTHYDN
ncbi:MAG: Txe/YoeB family addiction module toxin [Oscillospiraceae bacterium]|jgi:toxin YoeB|nr:Txe/YoeB family addiction module toxin [Oscillospiraceae bacterium]